MRACCELDPPLAVEAVEALHHVVRLAGPGTQARAGDDTGATRLPVRAAMVRNQASSTLWKGRSRDGPVALGRVAGMGVRSSGRLLSRKDDDFGNVKPRPE